MDNNYVKLDILDYNRLLTSEAWAEYYKAENLKLKEEQLKLEEEVSILNSIVDDRLANEECMTDPSQEQQVDLPQEGYFRNGELCLDGFKITENDWKELLAYLEIQQKDINILCSTLTSLASEKNKLTIDKYPR